MQHNRDVRQLLPKHAFRIAIATASPTTGLLYIWSGMATAQAIGPSVLFGDSDSTFLASPNDFALTFIPGSALSAGTHNIARTTVRNMAASNTAMRQGGKGAAVATEHAAARTETQHVAESQAAHTRAVGRVKEVNRRRR